MSETVYIGEINSTDLSRVITILQVQLLNPEGTKYLTFQVIFSDIAEDLKTGFAMPMENLLFV